MGKSCDLEIAVRVVEDVVRLDIAVYEKLVMHVLDAFCYAIERVDAEIFWIISTLAYFDSLRENVAHDILFNDKEGVFVIESLYKLYQVWAFDLEVSYSLVIKAL